MGKITRILREGKENGDWKKTVWIFGEIGEICKAWKPFLKCIFCEKEQWLSNNISIWYSLSPEKDYEDMGLGRTWIQLYKL